MCDPNADHGADNLHRDVGQCVRPPQFRRSANAMLTAGLKWAPDTGLKVRMSPVKIAPVGSVLQRRTRAPFPPESLEAMMPEPRTPMPYPSTRRHRAAPEMTLGTADNFELVLERQLIERPQRQRRENRDTLMQHAIAVFE